jgi:hypothetical protein
MGWVGRLYEDGRELERELRGSSRIQIFRRAQHFFGHCLGTTKVKGRHAWVFAQCFGDGVCVHAKSTVVIPMED